MASRNFVVEVTAAPRGCERQFAIALGGEHVEMAFDIGADMRRHDNRSRLTGFRCVDPAAFAVCGSPDYQNDLSVAVEMRSLASADAPHLGDRALRLARSVGELLESCAGRH